MTYDDLSKLVDKGRALKNEIDSLEAQLDGIKEILRKEAVKRKRDYFIGEKHFARISPDTQTSCDAEELHQAFKDIERPKDFYPCVKVLVGKAKSALGESVFAGVSDVTSEPYKKVSFLEAIPKKYIEE